MLPSISCLRKISFIRFTFINHILSVNSLSHLILCGYKNPIFKVYHNKIKENKAPCDRVKWSPGELWQLETENLDDQRQF